MNIFKNSQKLSKIAKNVENCQTSPKNILKCQKEQKYVTNSQKIYRHLIPKIAKIWLKIATSGHSAFEFFHFETLET